MHALTINFLEEVNKFTKLLKTKNKKQKLLASYSLGVF